MDLILGIDGGGTKTAAWLAPLLADAGADPLGAGAAGPGNPRAVGFDVALANIDAAIDAAFDQARISRTTVESACIALAGADRPVEKARIEAWAEQRQLCRKVLVTNDAAPILAAASPTGIGIALICGTGSFAFGRNIDTEPARCGGWGYLFGDEGSGYDIAVAGLRAAARAADGRDNSTALLNDILQRLGETAPSALITTIYHEFSRQQVADLSEVVFDAARRQDPTARQILETAADHLCELVKTLVHKLSLPVGEYPLALAGGVLMHAPQFCNAVVKRLNDIGIAPGSVTLVPEPVRGAVIMARRFAQ
jgi:N-acetylglucosamine kinase-like BadF-type ATPase